MSSSRAGAGLQCAREVDADREAPVLEGVVERGDARGRTLGFPTANLSCTDSAIPDGVYAATVLVAGSEHVAAVSVGRRGTFYGGDGVRLMEVHLLDFSGDLYGATMRVRLHRRLRGQRAFAGVADLVEQLRRDVAAVRAWSRRRETSVGPPTPANVPPWALRRAAGVLRSRAADRLPDARALARSAGISKGLARQCLALYVRTPERFPG